jgi:hypothetical protein
VRDAPSARYPAGFAPTAMSRRTNGDSPSYVRTKCAVVRVIKGNISRTSGDRIYHVPGSSSYEETIIDESAGERWFCSEAEARRAGWRAPRG